MANVETLSSIMARRFVFLRSGGQLKKAMAMNEHPREIL
jgi:hypothetical protein